MRYSIACIVGGVLLSTSAALAQDETGALDANDLFPPIVDPDYASQSDFERYMENATENARTVGEQERAAAIEAEVAARDREQGIGHDGRVPLGEEISLGGDAGETGAEVNIRIDTDILDTGLLD